MVAVIPSWFLGSYETDSSAKERNKVIERTHSLKAMAN